LPKSSIPEEFREFINDLRSFIKEKSLAESITVKFLSGKKFEEEVGIKHVYAFKRKNHRLRFVINRDVVIGELKRLEEFFGYRLALAKVYRKLFWVMIGASLREKYGLKGYPLHRKLHELEDEFLSRKKVTYIT